MKACSKLASLHHHCSPVCLISRIPPPFTCPCFSFLMINYISSSLPLKPPLFTFSTSYLFNTCSSISVQILLCECHFLLYEFSNLYFPQCPHTFWLDCVCLSTLQYTILCCSEFPSSSSSLCLRKLLGFGRHIAILHLLYLFMKLSSSSPFFLQACCKDLLIILVLLIIKALPPSHAEIIYCLLMVVAFFGLIDCGGSY